VVRAKAEEPSNGLAADERGRLQSRGGDRRADLEGDGLEPDELHEVGVELPERDREGRIGERRRVARDGRQDLREPGVGQRVVGPEAVHTRPHEPRCHDLLDLLFGPLRRPGRVVDRRRRRGYERRERDEDQREAAHTSPYRRTAVSPLGNM
jgi:hypothetical protein